jgi:two-component sensor histidine kinase
MKYPAFLAGLLLSIAHSLYAAAPVPKPPDTSRIKEAIRLANSYVRSNMDSFAWFARDAYDRATRIHDRQGVADAGVLLGNYHAGIGDYTQGIQDYQQAITIYDSLHQTSNAAWTYDQLAQLYKFLSGPNNTEQFIDRGIGYSYTAFDMYEKVKDTAGMIVSLNEAGILCRDKSRLPGKAPYIDTAFTLYNKALLLYQWSGKGATTVPKLYNNISQVYMEYKQQPRTALIWLARAVALNEADHNPVGLTYNYNSIAQAYAQLGRIDSSLLYARKMLTIACGMKLPARTYDSYEQLYSTFDAGHQPDSALKYFILATRLNDSLTNLAKTKEVLYLQAKYEDVKKELDIRTLSEDNASKSKKIVLLTILSVFLVVLAAAFTYLIQRLRTQKWQIGAQRQRLEVMLRELHHRVKNNLQIVSSLLSLQSYRSDNQHTTAILQESQQRVQAMSLIHQRLYKEGALSTVNIREFLDDLTASLLASYGYDKNSFDLQIEVGSEHLDIDHALPIGLIVNELVTNAFKYAYHGIDQPSLRISLLQGNIDIVLCVRDNGVGMNEEKWNKGQESFGKQLIVALCHQLRARQQLTAGDGTGFIITIPRTAV